MSQQENSRAIDYGATVVITHRVRSGMHPLYDTWLSEIVPLCRDAAGFLDWQIVRPVAGLTSTYTVIIRFDTPEHLREWMMSSQRRRLIEQVRPLLAKDDDFIVRSGLDFWFTPEGAQAKIPAPWKQWLATWSAIYPLVSSAVICKSAPARVRHSIQLLFRYAGHYRRGGFADGVCCNAALHASAESLVI